MEPGQIHMIDVTEKEETEREAVATGLVKMKPSTLESIRRGEMAKGDVLVVAKTAAIMAAKDTHRLIPLCHPLLLTSIAVAFSFAASGDAVQIVASTRGVGKTGFEMEALVAVATAALTVYDMCKMVDKDMVIGEVRLLSKSGGKSGLYVAGAQE